MSKHVHVIGLGHTLVGFSVQPGMGVVLRLSNQSNPLDITKRVPKEVVQESTQELTYLVVPQLDQAIALIRALFPNLEDLESLIEEVRVHYNEKAAMKPIMPK